MPNMSCNPVHFHDDTQSTAALFWQALDATNKCMPIFMRYLDVNSRNQEKEEDPLLFRLQSLTQSLLSFIRSFHGTLISWQYLFSNEENDKFNEIYTQFDRLQQDVNVAIQNDRCSILCKQDSTVSKVALVDITFHFDEAKCNSYFHEQFRKDVVTSLRNDLIYDKILLIENLQCKSSTNQQIITMDDVFSIRQNISQLRENLRLEIDAATVGVEIDEIRKELDNYFTKFEKNGGIHLTESEISIHTEISNTSETSLTKRVKVISFDNGRYEGEMKCGKFNGNGKYFYNDGDRYEGEYKDDKINGKGVYFYSNGNRYVGEFKNDKIDGIGIYFFNDGSRYEGEFEDGKKNGRGIMYYFNGDRYEGDFCDERITGFGIFRYENGDYFEGEFLNDEQLTGTLFSPSTDREESMNGSSEND